MMFPFDKNLHVNDKFFIMLTCFALLTYEKGPCSCTAPFVEGVLANPLLSRISSLSLFYMHVNQSCQENCFLDTRK